MSFDWTNIVKIGFTPGSSFNPQLTPKPPPKVAEKLYIGNTVPSPGSLDAIMMDGLQFDLQNKFLQPKIRLINSQIISQQTHNLNLVFDNGDTQFIELDAIFNEQEITILKNWINKNENELLKISNEYDANRRQFYHFLYDLVALVKALEKIPSEYHTNLIDTVNSGDKLMHNRVLAEIANTLFSSSSHIVKIEPNLKTWKKNPDLIIDGIKADVKTILTTATNDVDSLSDFAFKISKDIIEPEKEKNQLGKGGIFFISPWSPIINSLLYVFFHKMKLEGKHSLNEIKYYNDLPSIKEGQTVFVLTVHQAFKNGFLVFDTRWVHEDFAQQGYPMIEKYDSLSYLALTSIREGCPLGIAGIDQSLMFYVR